MKKRIKRKQLELLHDALGIMAAELVSVENSLNQRKQCRCNQAKFGPLSFSLQINPLEHVSVSFLSYFHGLSIGVTHTINLKTDLIQ